MKQFTLAGASALFSFYSLFLLASFNVESHNLIANFHLSTSQFGLFGSMDLVANAVGLLFIGRLIDKYNIRIIGCSFLLLATISCFTLGYASHLYLDYIARFIQGLASACSLLICLRIANNIFKNKAFATGVMISIALLGGVFANTIYAYFIQNSSLIYGYQIAGYIGIGIFFFNFLFLKPFDIPKKTVKNKLFTKNILYTGLILGLLNTPVFVLGSLWGDYSLHHLFHHSFMINSLLSSGVFLGVIIGSPLWGKLADKVNQPINLIKMAILGCILISSIYTKLPLNMVSIFSLYFFIGLLSSSQNILYPYLSHSFPKQYQSYLMGITTCLANFSGALSEWGYGFGFSKTTLLSAGFFVVCFTICLGLLYLLQTNQRCIR